METDPKTKIAESMLAEMDLKNGQMGGTTDAW